jgi:hypothetical protein
MPTRCRMPPEKPRSGRLRHCAVDQFEQLADATACNSCVESLHRRQILDKLDGIQIGIRAEVLRKIAEHGTECIRIASNVHFVPKHAAFTRFGDGGKNAHQRSFCPHRWDRASQVRMDEG